MRREQAAVTAQPAMPLPASRPFASFAGTYSHHAYGTYDICELPSASTAPSARCHISDVRWKEVQNANVSTGNPSLGVAISAAIGNFIQLDHFSENIFNVTVFEITTAPKSDEIVVVPPSFDEPKPTLEFSLDQRGQIDGFGLTRVWGEGSGVPLPKGDTVKERAEVWFDRLN